jgi:2-iminobutanoate/2-iminopropanoate deaminase
MVNSESSKLKSIQFANAANGPATSGGYSQVVSLSANTQQIFVSGQIPEDANGFVPKDFESQCRLVWRNVQLQLEAVGASLADIVKVTTYLSDRQYRDINSRVRAEVLQGISPALTVVIAVIYDEVWLLEIEVIACVGG